MTTLVCGRKSDTKNYEYTYRNRHFFYFKKAGACESGHNGSCTMNRGTSAGKNPWLMRKRQQICRGDHQQEIKEACQVLLCVRDWFFIFIQIP